MKNPDASIIDALRHARIELLVKENRRPDYFCLTQEQHNRFKHEADVLMYTKGVGLIPQDSFEGFPLVIAGSSDDQRRRELNQRAIEL